MDIQVNISSGFVVSVPDQDAEEFIYRVRNNQVSEDEINQLGKQVYFEGLTWFTGENDEKLIEAKKDSTYYHIDGYYLDDLDHKFTDYIVCAYKGFTENKMNITEDQIFCFGLSRRKAISLIDVSTSADFVITRVKDFY